MPTANLSANLSCINYGLKEGFRPPSQQENYILRL